MTAIPKSVIRTWPSSSMSTLAGLQVAVEDALRVRGREPAAQLAARCPMTFSDGRRPTRLMQRREVLALHQFHREEDFAVGFADVEDAAHRRMRDLPRQPDLVRGCGDRASRGVERINLRATRRPQHEIVGAPHVAHAAPADARDHPVAPGNTLAGGKNGRWRHRSGTRWRAPLPELLSSW